MKVLRIISRLNIGGPARHVVLLDRGLRARGYETLLVHGSLDSFEGSLEQLAAEYEVPAIRIPELGRSVNIFSDLRAFLSLLRITFREAPDVVHTHTAKAGTLGRLAAMVFNLTRPRRKRCVIVHTFHGHVLAGYFGPLGSRLVRLAERTLAAGTDCIVTISPLQKKDIVDRFGVASDVQTFVVPLGLDLGPFLQQLPGDVRLRGKLGIPPDAVVVTYVGRFVAIKDVGTLIRAFTEAGRGNDKMWLLLVGDGPLRGEMENRVRESGLGARVRFAGWTQDLLSVYAASDICALSSLNEGTPVSLIEAMAAGKAVVASAVGGVPDLVDDGTTGLLVDSRDARGMAAALTRLAGDGLERTRLAQAGRSAVSERFSSNRLVDDIDRLYVNALAAKRAAAVVTAVHTR